MLEEGTVGWHGRNGQWSEVDLQAERTSSEMNPARAKVRAAQKVPDTENSDAGDAKTFCSGGNANWGKYGKSLPAHYKPLPLPPEPAWTPISSLEEHNRPHRCVTLSAGPDCPLGHGWGHRPLLTGGFGHPFMVWGTGTCFLTLHGRRTQQVLAVGSQWEQEEIQYRNVVCFSPQSHTAQALSLLRDSLLPLRAAAIRGTLGTEGQRWQHSTLQPKKGLQSLVLPAPFCRDTRKSPKPPCEDTVVLHCLHHRNVLKKTWPSKEQALYIWTQTCMFTYITNQSMHSPAPP